MLKAESDRINFADEYADAKDNFIKHLRETKTINQNSLKEKYHKWMNAYKDFNTFHAQLMSMQQEYAKIYAETEKLEQAILSKVVDVDLSEYSNPI